MIAGTLEIQLLANMARLQKDMDDAKASVGNAMKSIETAVGYAKTALVAFAGVASFNAFKGMIQGSIEATAGLHDMAMQTGASVAALAAFRSVAATSTTSIDGIAGSMNKLAKGMAVANEDSKGIGQAVKALGLDFAALKSQRPEDQMLAVAKALDGFQDGAGKSAVAMTLFGKEGAKMLPFLKDLAAESEAVTAKLTEQQVAAKAAQAAMADDYSDNLTKIQKASDAWKKDVSMAMLPALYELSQAFIDVNNGAHGINQGVSDLATDGSITSWTRSAIFGLTYVMDAFEGVKVVVVSLGKYLGAWAATAVEQVTMVWNVAKGLFGKEPITNIINASMERQRAIAQGLKEDLEGAWGTQTFGARLRDRMKDLQGVAVQAKAAKESLNFSAVGDKSDKGQGDKVSEYQRLMTAISEKAALQRLDLESQGKLTEGQKFAVKIMDDLRTGTLELNEAEKQKLAVALESYLQDEKSNLAMAKLEKATLAAAEARLKLVEGLAQGLEKLEAETLAQQEHNDRLGLSKEAIADLDAAKLQLQATTLDLMATKALEKDQDEDQYLLYKLQAQELRKLAELKKQGAFKEAQIDAAKAVNAEWKRGWEETDRLSRGVFVTWVKEGSSAAEKIGDAFETALLSAIYEASAKPIAFQIYSSATSALGIPGVGGSSGSSGGAGGLLDSASNAYSLYNKASSFFGGGAGASIFALGGVAPGASAVLPAVTELGALSGLTEAGTSIYSLATPAATGLTLNTFGAGLGATGATAVGSTVAAPLAGAAPAAGIPGIGWAIGGALLLAGLMGGNKNWETKYGGSFDNTGPDGAINKISGPGTGGEFPAQYAQKALQATEVGINETLKLLGSKARLGYFSAGAESSGEGQAFANAGGKLVRADGSIVEFGQSSQSGGYLNRRGNKSPEQAAKEYGEELQQATLQALQTATDIPKAISNALKGVDVDSLTGDALAAFAASVNKIITDVKTLQDAMLSLPFEKLKDLSFDAAAALIAASGGFDKLNANITAYYDNFYSAEEKRAQTLTNISKRLADAGITLTTEALAKMSRADFRGVVDTIQSTFTGQASTGMVAALLEVSGAFASVTSAAADSTTALVATKKALLDAATGAASAALAGLTKSVDAQKSTLATAYDLQVNRFNTQLGTVSASVGRLQTLANSLKGTLDGMRIAGQEGQQRAAAQAQISAALAIARAGGPLPLDGQLDTALRTVAQPSEQLYATFTDYARDFYKTANDIAALGDLTGEQLTADQITQDLLQDQLKQAKTAYEAQVKGLDDTTRIAQQQLEAANGTYTAILSLTDAIKATTNATQTLMRERAGQGLSTGVVVGGALQTVAPDAGRLQSIRDYINTLDFSESGAAASVAQLYAAAKQYGVNQTELAAASGYNLDDVQKLFAKYGIPAFDVGTNYVPQDMLAQIHKGEAIVPAAYNPAAGGQGGDNSALLAEMRAMRAEIAALRASAADTADNTKRTASTLVNVTRGGEAMQTQVYA